MIAAEFQWIEDVAYNTYSQFGEDGVLKAIFRVIGALNEWCMECGAADGLFFSNTRRLIENGWHAVLIEADRATFARLHQNCAGFGERVQCFQVQVDHDHRLETILRRVNAPLDIDLVVIDVDGQDYYLWNALHRYRPRVVVIEYDQNVDQDFIPPLGGAGQAGERAIYSLGVGKYYTPVYRSKTNLIFVQRPLDRLLKGTRESMLQQREAKL